MKRRLLWALPLVVVLIGSASLLRPGAFDFAGTSGPYQAAMAAARDDADRGIATFAFGDWGALSSDTLRTSGQPWKLVTAALALQAAAGDPVAAGQTTIPDLYRRYGFHWPGTFGNWPDDLPQPTRDSPVGLNTAPALNVWPPIGATIGNIGCAACHSSVMYDDTGSPDLTRVWLGGPNGSINLKAWTRDLFTALRDHGGETDLLMQVVAALFPDTDIRERMTLRHAILPALQETVAARDAAYGRLLPFRASLAGATNGLDSLQNRLGLIPEGTVLTESIFNSVPDLGGRLWRTRLLNSGTYAIPGIPDATAMTADLITPDHRLGLAGIIAYFSVPSMGVTEAVAEAHIPDALLITDWMAEYRPQPFPGPVDATLLPRGLQIYALACAACHGTYDTSLTEPGMTGFPNWEGDIGTDPQRALLLTQTIADAVNGGIFGRYITARTVSSYAAPPLSGLWSSAPYLHNGAVPTLWHLMRPDLRPAWFEVGGHRLNYARVGIDLAPAAGYVPWSEPAEVDTTAFGLSNTGHEVGFVGLSEADKEALLEYLKLL